MSYSQALVNAVSQVRLENGKTPPQIRQFFIDQLRYNDNTTNQVCLKRHGNDAEADVRYAVF